MLTAQTPATPSVATPAQTAAALRGKIADPTGALIPGVKVTVLNAQGKTVASTSSDATGNYSVTGLPAGTYTVLATIDGFAPFNSQALQLAANQTKHVDISMAIEAAQQSVTVTDEDGAPQVSIEAGANGDAMVLKGKDLDALSDDPDELSSELSALAGPSAGPNGGQIYIDGFTGGTLPPKSAIREIRINQNPFSAEFDRMGYGRIEILTKPGTDTLHGRAFIQGNDKALNTSNPFAPPPSYYSVQYNASVSGALNSKTSYFLSLDGRENPDASVYSVSMPLFNTTTQQYYIPYESDGKTVIPTTGAVYSPSHRFEFSPRIDLQLGSKNTLTVRYQYERGSSSNSVGNTSLPTTATGSSSTEHSLQITDSQIINDHIVNETHFQLRRAPNTSSEISDAPSYGVGGYFSAGGGGGASTSDSTHMELQNATTMSAGAHAIKFGLWARDNYNSSDSTGGFNGNFSFLTLDAYVDTLNGMLPAQHETVAYIQSHCPTGASGCTPNMLSYTTGNQKYKANVFDGALYFQDDWKFNRLLTLSGGIRWETQNHIVDHSDFAPRFSLAYAVDGHKKGTKTKTVFRAGYGFFYDRFSVGSLMGLAEDNGGPNSQVHITVNNPTCFSQTSLADALAQTGSNCSTASSSTSTIETIKPNYHSPVSEQFTTSIERQLTKTTSLTVTYIHTYGVHQSATRDSNAYAPGDYSFSPITGLPTITGTRPNPSLGIVNEIYNEAVFKQNQVNVSINARLTPNFTVMGYYSRGYADGDTGSASNSYDLKQDYGRSSFTQRNMVFLMGTINGKWGISYNPMLNAQSGRPYGIFTSYDLTGDQYYNDRPAYAANSTSCTGSNGQYVQTTFGCLDVVPQPGESLVPVNMANGPASVTLNLRVSRSWGVGPKVASANGPNGPGGFPGGGMGGPPPGGGGGGPRGGGGGGGFGGGGFGGPMGGFGGGGRGGMSGTGRKYSLNFSAQAQNLFNDVNYGTPSGTIVPTLVSGSGTSAVWGPGSRFGTSTTLAGGGFSRGGSASAVRRIYLQASFSF
jgi:hypothetical protein